MKSEQKTAKPSPSPAGKAVKIPRTVKAASKTTPKAALSKAAARPKAPLPKSGRAKAQITKMALKSERKPEQMSEPPVRKAPLDAPENLAFKTSPAFKAWRRSFITSTEQARALSETVGARLFGQRHPLSGLADISLAGKEAARMTEAAVQASLDSAAKVSAELKSFAATAFEHGLHASQTLRSAKSLPEALACQSDYVQKAASSWLDHLEKLNMIGLETIERAFEPLSDQMDAALAKRKADPEA